MRPKTTLAMLFLSLLTSACSRSLDNYALGVADEKSGHYQKAIEAYSEALEQKPDSYLVYSSRGAAYLRLGEYQKAIDDCSKAIALSPSTYVPHFVFYTRGRAYLRLAQYQKAVDDCSKAVALQPGYAEAYFCRAQAYQRLGRPVLATQDFAKSKELGYKQAKQEF